MKLHPSSRIISSSSVLIGLFDRRLTPISRFHLSASSQYLEPSNRSLVERMGFLDGIGRLVMIAKQVKNEKGGFVC
jgi:hypothetical protein